MTILEKIVLDKKLEIKLKKKIFSIPYLKSSPLFNLKTISLVKRLKNSNSGIIAEHKRKSPSKQNINSYSSVIDIIKGYENAGASGISVLTDKKYFGGSLEDLNLSKATSSIPLLRKEFIVDPYQIIESKANGADVILLIAGILSKKEIKQFSLSAKELGIEVLLEIHNKEELEKSIMPSIDMIGVNNRNLKTFKVNLDVSRELSEYIPKEFLKISESGINSIQSIGNLKSYGFDGFLVGENFMKTKDPGKTALKFIKKLEDEA